MPLRRLYKGSGKKGQCTLFTRLHEMDFNLIKIEARLGRNIHIRLFGAPYDYRVPPGRAVQLQIVGTGPKRNFIITMISPASRERDHGVFTHHETKLFIKTLNVLGKRINQKSIHPYWRIPAQLLLIVLRLLQNHPDSLEEITQTAKTQEDFLALAVLI